MTALLLAESGVEVAVVEGRRLGAGTTGATTGKVSLLQGTRAQRIAARHSDRTVTEYVEANRAGQQWLLRYCEEHALPVQRVHALTYAQNEYEIPAVRAELQATRAAGLDTYPVDDLDVPFPFHGAVGLADQAQLDPMALLATLAADVEAHAAPIFESTIAHGVHHRDNDDLVIDTEHGEPPRWSGALASWRPAELKAIPSAAQTNSAVALRLSTGWLRVARSGYGPIPTEGCGHVERHGLQPTAVSTVDGKTTEVSAICPHLYGIVRWNDAEKSWDCPLHGSRFTADGTLLDGPATASLPLISGPAAVPVTGPPRGGPTTVLPEKI
ncbi:FAD-dependent oxidoreductase [Nocardia sp. CWNU-33]|uniref:FAD-dependent oxidoreductase n=1 Tax=Nocardia sp. CWNU-33 TaxID=3392117 RepID=UPI00398F8900